MTISLAKAEEFLNTDLCSIWHVGKKYFARPKFKETNGLFLEIEIGNKTLQFRREDNATVQINISSMLLIDSELEPHALTLYKMTNLEEELDEDEDWDNDVEETN